MDPARIEPVARNGSGLRPSRMAEGASQMVGALAAGPAGVCPYRLGTTCPLVAIAARRVKARKRALLASKIAAVIAGIVVSASAVAWVYGAS